MIAEWNLPANVTGEPVRPCDPMRFDAEHPECSRRSVSGDTICALPAAASKQIRRCHSCGGIADRRLLRQ